MSKIILGTVQFGLDYGINNSNGKPSDKEVESILDFAYKSGISILDTAEAYGNSQERIGYYHKNRKNKFSVITKFDGDSTLKDIKDRIYCNLDSLLVEKLYAYMFHSFEQYKLFYSNFKSDLLKLKKEGVIENIGVSVYTNSEIKQVLEDDSISLIQVPYNLFDNERKRGDILRKVKAKRIEVHTRSAFLQGLFFKDVESLSGNLVNLKQNLKDLDEVTLGNRGLKLELALGYPQSKSYIDNIVVGVDNRSQLEQIIEISNKKGLENQYNKIDTIDIKNIDLLNPSKWVL